MNVTSKAKHHKIGRTLKKDTIYGRTLKKDTIYGRAYKI
jgi:hypothetical protein